MAMKAKLTTEEHAQLSPEFQKEYVEKDGTFVLDVTPVDGLALDDARGLRSALQKERENVAERDRQLRDFKDLDPTKAREALTKVEEMANWKPEDKVREQIEAQSRQLTEKHEREIAAKDTEINDLTGQLESHLVDAVATAALTEHKGNVKLLLPHIRSKTKVMRENGKFVARVIGEDGNTLVSMKQGSTDPMGVTELVGEMKNDPTFAPAFIGVDASGPGVSPHVKRTASGVHVISAADAAEPAKYRAAKEAARKAGVELQLEQTVVQPQPLVLPTE
jgi:hypothetical protein